MMKEKTSVWDQMDKAQIPLDRLVEEDLLVCRTEAKSSKTLRRLDSIFEYFPKVGTQYSAHGCNYPLSQGIHQIAKTNLT
jgi:ABC-type branched-subunit amino acid transport system ATPase component